MLNKKTPMRKCVGCNTSKPQNELIRISYYEGELHIDKDAKSNGRGIYICKNKPSCIESAQKRKAVYRNFHNVDPKKVDKLFKDLRELED